MTPQRSTLWPHGNGAVRAPIPATPGTAPPAWSPPSPTPHGPAVTLPCSPPWPRPPPGSTSACSTCRGCCRACASDDPVPPGRSTTPPNSSVTGPWPAGRSRSPNGSRSDGEPRLHAWSLRRRYRAPAPVAGNRRRFPARVRLRLCPATAPGPRTSPRSSTPSTASPTACVSSPMPRAAPSTATGRSVSIPSAPRDVPQAGRVDGARLDP